ncbi:MAG: asparagine synthase (glutamine-hydrolyzing) [Acidobacteria bacterium]|nr:asparagine synthase (glutamine-hydrolyzing) [Acidobacteriota bacterium]
MCGIAGVFDTAPDARVEGSDVRRMLASIAHRGPDDEGLHDGGSLVFGTRRLKIIDLAGGHQPLSNEDGTVWVAFNGEIFNHDARRDALRRSGHDFRTRCDTEVIVHEWEERGVDCVEHLHGQFGFAVWDQEKRTLMLARDRLGIKPVYYAWAGTRLVFASEIKAILATGAVTPEVDLQSLYHYVGYEFVPAPATMFRGIRKLPAGHRLVVSGGTSLVEPYWKVDVEPVDVSEAECIRTIRQLLGEAVEQRLMSEVPLGVFLSGGLDSTAVLAYACQATDRRLPTFTIGYADGSFSEWEHARRAARHYGTTHHEIVIDPITPELIEKAVWHLDEPMTDLSSIPFHILCRQARGHATVCLSGEGGDEVFVGYDRFVASRIEQTVYRHVPSALRNRVIAPLVARLPDRPQKKGTINLVKRFVQGASLPEEGGHMRWQFFSSEMQENRLFGADFLGAVTTDPFEPVRRHAARAAATDRVGRECYVDLCLTMPDSVLMKVDKMSMALGLEVRVPFLDHRLVEFAARIPSRLKFPGLRTRAVYRRAMTGVLPAFVLERGKQGYSLPLKTWLRGELREYMVNLLTTSPLIREHFNPGGVRALMDEHVRGVCNHNHVLWALMNAALWHRRFVEPATPAE